MAKPVEASKIITSDTLIQLDEDGSHCRTKDLSIGEFILNPLSGRKTEIIDLAAVSPCLLDQIRLTRIFQCTCT